MKITNWRRKLAASLMAGGVLAPAALHAQSLDTNLVVNPGFELVDAGTIGTYNSVKILNWGDGSQTPFAYNISQGYDNGNPLAGGGAYYFSSNGTADFSVPDVRIPGQVSQNIPVGAGAAGAQIASGEAAVRLSGYFTSYQQDGDYGHLHVEFLDSGGASLGSTEIDGSADTSAWRQVSSIAFIPPATKTLRTSLYGTPFSGGPDGYIDNVDVQVTDSANAIGDLLYLHVNTANGQVAIKNQTGDPVHLDYYSISSAGSALNKASWTSLQDQNLAGFPAGNGTGNGWEEAGVTNAKVLGESFLTGNSLVANGAAVPLGGAFNVGGAHDLVFRYSMVPAPTLPLQADFDGDGDADGADFLAWQKGQGITVGATKSQGDADGDLDVDADDLAAWKHEFGGARGAGNLVTGFIQYETTGPATSVPEPAGVWLAAALLAPLVMQRRGRE
jgi:hypothetical protein